MDKIKSSLKGLGLSDKEIGVYLTLLSLGPAPIRRIGERAAINRGTTHEALKTLQKEGLVAYHHKEKHQHFIAEDPLVLVNLIRKRKDELEGAALNIKEVIPELRSLHSEIAERPVVKYYEGSQGIRTILNDVLDSTEKLSKKEYSVYSSSKIRPYLYQKDAFPNFTEERIGRKIFVRTIAIGEGGKEAGLDERRWLTKNGAPTYTLIYAGRVAMISIDKKEHLRGVIIEDQYLFETQELLFNALWKTLGK